ncbi:MAG TPA: hypothetical protein VN151_06995 [Terracidiphilus sp.]|nr:hypothetical protein [Terracidiphilus sp.]
MRIFGRSEGYDPGEDNIVRSYARMLRRRLDVYFTNEGAHEQLRLTVPRGAYIPAFCTAPGVKKPAVVAVPISIDPPLTNATATIAAGETLPVSFQRWRWAAGGALAGIFALLLVLVGARVIEQFRNASAAHALWTQLFEKDRTTLIVPADSGLGIVENLTRTQPTANDYTNGTYFAGLRAPDGIDADNFNDLRRQHYTSTVDLGISAALERLPELDEGRPEIRFARDVAVEEIRNANVILLGSAHSNPWVTLFEPRLNFQFVYTPEVDHSYILNRHPQSGEPAMYANGTANGRAPTFGTVAYLPDAGGAAHVLIVEGLNMAATQAAANILFNSSEIQPALRAAAAPGGRLRAFELLVETTSVNASAPTAHIIATRVYPET